MTIRMRVVEAVDKEVPYIDNMTVADALTVCGCGLAGKNVKVKVNDSKANADTVLHDGDKVLVTPRVKNG